MNNALRLVALVALLAVATWVSRRRDRADRPPPLLRGFWGSLASAYRGRNALFVVAAVATTVLLVVAGWDRALQDLAQRGDPLGRGFSRALLVYGGYWTAAVAVVLLALLLVRRAGPWRLAGAVALQAVLAGLVVTLALKMLTGRRGPAGPHHRAPFRKTQDPSDFAFDFWQRTDGDGRFFWPSGHTMTSTVLVAALAAAFPRSRWIAWVGGPLVALMGVAMVDGDFHWTSDVVAAVLLGLPLGRAIGARLAVETERRAGPGP